MKALRILIGDDESIRLLSLRAHLTALGHQVVGEASTGEEAVALAEKSQPDLAILDIKLKKMTGVEVLEELKKISQGIKVIMLTGYPTLETARESVRLGACEYCVKPIDKDELERKVAEALAAG